MNISTDDSPNRGAQLQQAFRDFIYEPLDETAGFWMETCLTIGLSIVIQTTTIFSGRISSPIKSRD